MEEKYGVITYKYIKIKRKGKKMKIPFSPPDVTETEIEQVVEALRSGWITTGPKTKELERKVAEFCGVSRAVCLNSQTACAEMTLRLLGVSGEDEVITCAYTYTASASVVCHVGAKLVLIDTQKTPWKWITTSWKIQLQRGQR